MTTRKKNHPFIPDGFETAISEDDQTVLVQFLRDDKRLEVEIPRSRLPALAREIQRRISPGDAVPIDAASLRPDRTLNVQAYEARRNPDGSIRLTLYVTLYDQDSSRGVTIPLTLSRADTRSLVEMLKSRLSNH